MQFMISLGQDSTGGLAGFSTQGLIRLKLRCQPRLPFSSELGIFFQATVVVRTHSKQLQDKNPQFFAMWSSLQHGHLLVQGRQVNIVLTSQSSTQARLGLCFKVLTILGRLTSQNLQFD